jgi:hypothetical protein
MQEPTKNPLAGEASGSGTLSASERADATPTPTPHQGVTRRWRDHLPVHSACDALPMMSGPELRELADDIRAHGLLRGVDVARSYRGDKKQYVLLDGRHRLDALELLGKTVIDESGLLDSQIIASEFTERPDEVARIISANIRRRHLQPEQKRDVLAALLKAGPERSNRQIGTLAGADHKTAAVVRRDLEQAGSIPRLDKTTGKVADRARQNLDERRLPRCRCARRSASMWILHRHHHHHPRST